MKKKPIALAALSLVGLMLSGCATANRGTPAMGFGQANIQANLNRPDMEVIGPVEGKSTVQSYLFGLVRVIDGDKYQVLGIKFFEDQYAFMKQKGGIMVTPEDRAYYKALASTPDADAVFTKSYMKSKRSYLGFYSTKDVTYQGKAIKVKADK